MTYDEDLLKPLPRPKRTKLIHWRGGGIEFGTETVHDAVCRPPWFVIKLSGGNFSKRGWYYWLDYLGPPHVFLTRMQAEIKARQLRHQYNACGPWTTVEVIRLEPADAQG